MSGDVFEEKVGTPMAINAITYDITFGDFQFLQGYMARRVFARNRSKYGTALAGVVLCAIFLAMAIVVNVNPYRIVAFFGFGIRYSLSVYLLDRKSTRLNSSHIQKSRMPSSA